VSQTFSFTFNRLSQGGRVEKK